MKNGRSLQFTIPLCALAITCLLAPALWAAQRPRVGDQVQSFKFADFSGQSHALSDYNGRYVLLDFWATWCGPCVKEIPVLKQAQQLYGSRGLEIIGMDSDKDAAKARKFIARNQIEWPQSAPASTTQVIDGAIGIKWYPALVLLDPQHKIVLISGNGGRTLNGKKLLKALDEILPK